MLTSRTSSDTAWQRTCLNRTRRILLTAALLFAVASPAAAAKERPDFVTPPRLALTEGDVSSWRPGEDTWQTARRNAALAAGDVLETGPDSRLEVQIGPRAYLRVGGETRIRLEELEADFLRFRIERGRLTLDMDSVQPGFTVEISTAAATLRTRRAGSYRVDVGLRSSAFIARRGGRAEIRPQRGRARELRSGEQAIAGATDADPVEISRAPIPDAWDGWNDGRDERLVSRGGPADPLPPAMYGSEELDAYGTWQTTREYGRIWLPRGLAGDWAPYTAGVWGWDPVYGRTWIDDAPWGWTPFHYGRWVYFRRHWAWAPGPILAAPVYAPALVGFLGSDVSLQFSWGTPAYSWVALGWGEPLLPWWGGAGFIGQPWWGGWWGPHVVNHVVVHHRRRVHRNRIREYEHQRRRHAVVAARRGRRGGLHFGRPHRVPARLARRLRPARRPFRVRTAALARARRVPPARKRISTRDTHRRPETRSRQLTHRTAPQRFAARRAARWGSGARPQKRRAVRNRRADARRRPSTVSPPARRRRGAGFRQRERAYERRSQARTVRSNRYRSRQPAASPPRLTSSRARTRRPPQARRDLTSRYRVRARARARTVSPRISRPPVRQHSRRIARDSRRTRSRAVRRSHRQNTGRHFASRNRRGPGRRSRVVASARVHPRGNSRYRYRSRNR